MSGREGQRRLGQFGERIVVVVGDVVSVDFLKTRQFKLDPRN